MADLVRYSWPATDQNEASIAGGRLAEQIRARVGLAGWALDAATQAAIAELLAATTDVENVRSWGAKGDGVTLDRIAVQNAFTAAAGGAVVVPPGTYILQGAVTVPSNTSIYLARGATLKLSGSVDAHVLRATSAVSGVYIYGGGCIDGTGATTANCIDLAGATDVVIENIELKNAARAGINVTTATRLQLRGLRIHDCGREGIVVLDGSDIEIEGGEIHDVQRSGIRITPTTADMSRVRVRGVVMNDVAQDATAVPWGIYFNSGDNWIVKQSLMEGVIVDGSAYGGLFPGGDNNEVNGCQAWNCDFDGLWMHDSRGIVVNGGIYGLCGERGVRVGKAHEVSIIGTRTYRNDKEGIKLEYSSATSGRYQTTDTNRDVTVLGTINTENSQESTGTYPGIRLTGNMRNCVLIGNLGIDRQGTATQNKCLDSGTEGSGHIVIGNIGDGVTDSNSVEPADANFVFMNRTMTTKNFTDADATPSVLGQRVFAFANTGATTVTQFDDGVENQEIVVKLDANTTIQHGSNIKLASGADYSGSANDMLTLMKIGNVWYETARSVNG